MSDAGTVVMIRGGVPVVVPASALPVPQQATYDGLAAALASANAAMVALTWRVAALEGKPDPCVALAGSIAPATLTIGPVVLSVPVAGLLAGDVVLVEPVVDLPPGLALAWAHPKAAGVLSVGLSAAVALSFKAPIALGIRALR